MEACKNRRDKHFSGAVVPTFLHRDGLNDLWRSLTAPKLCLFDVDCIFIHQLVGLLIGKSKTRWGNTAKRGDKLPSLFTLSGWPFFSLFIPTTCTSYAPDRTLSFPASYAFHSSWATAMCESNSALGEKSLLLHLPCLFQPPLELSAAEAFNLLQKREWVFSGPMLHMACALPSAGLYINPQRLLILPRVPARKQSS